MRGLAALLRGQRAGIVVLVLLVAVSIGVPAVSSLLGAHDGSAALDGPSVGVLSTAAVGGLPRLLLADANVRLDALVPAALVVEPRPAGDASPAKGRGRAESASLPRAAETPLRI